MTSLRHGSGRWEKGEPKVDAWAIQDFFIF